ncbi:hypothetical protein IAT38_001105 [Cryptococcus sp. DSM 104549]
MAQKQASKTNQAITLKGSTALVTEFFEYGVNNILFLREVYPPEYFARVKKYGLPMMVTTEDDLKDYLKTVLSQVQEWLLSGNINRLVLAIKAVETGETLERWQFDIYTEESTNSSLPGGPPKTANGKKKEKTEKEVQVEIREIMKQITSCTTVLPILEEECSFTLLAYTNDSPDVAIPATWDDADPHLIDKGKVEQVRLRSFSTNVHALEAMVAYRIEE